MTPSEPTDRASPRAVRTVSAVIRTQHSSGPGVEQPVASPARVLRPRRARQPAVACVIALRLRLAAVGPVPVECPGSTHEREISGRGNSRRVIRS